MILNLSDRASFVADNILEIIAEAEGEPAYRTASCIFEFGAAFGMNSTPSSQPSRGKADDSPRSQYAN
jgi:hypothetical protein